MAATSNTLGFRSTALEALRGQDLSGLSAIVTGGNGGIGVDTVRALAHAGASVILAARSVAAGEKVAREIRQSGVKGSIIVRKLDLADLRSVRRFAEGVAAELPRLDLLLLNAGVLAYPSRQTTADGFEMALGTNHVGHQYLAQLLLPKLKQAPAARVVAVSSIGHKLGGLDLGDLNWERRRYSPWLAYGQSKMANLLFAKELARRMAEEGAPVRAYAVHPGLIRTGISRNMWCVFWALASLLLWLPFVKTTEQGAATTVYAATAAELDSQSGAYLHDCGVGVPSKAAQDPELAKKLWTKTEEMIEAALARAEAGAAAAV